MADNSKSLAVVQLVRTHLQCVNTDAKDGGIAIFFSFWLLQIRRSLPQFPTFVDGEWNGI